MHGSYPLLNTSHHAQPRSGPTPAGPAAPPTTPRGAGALFVIKVKCNMYKLEVNLIILTNSPSQHI